MKKQKPKIKNLKFLGSFPGLLDGDHEIFLVTSSTKTGLRSRCWGWYLTLREAKKAVKINAGDMHEMEYKWVVIERVQAGIPSLSEQVCWYHLVMGSTYMKNKWVSCPQPKIMEHVIGWGIG